MTYPGGMPVSNAIFNKALDVYRNDPTTVEDDLLSALEAVAPMLIAQGMREAALLLHGGELAYFIDGKIENLHSNLDAVVILNRAREIDPQ